MTPELVSSAAGVLPLLLEEACEVRPVGPKNIKGKRKKNIIEI